MPSTIRRQIFLDHGRALIEAPRLMTDAELAKVPAALAEEVMGRVVGDLFG
jgi:hypothetical protein